jgi:3-(3-hydroxy-phenyl)propionate hydroxylase
VVGHSDFRLDWVSVYTFQCRRLDSFLHGPVIFAGDSAHVVSPFGARGGNGGLDDVNALGWRLAAVLDGRAGPEALAAYDAERGFGADENIRHSTRATRFMTPEDGAERWFRDAVLTLAAKADFACPMVNSGRLSHPCTYPLAAPDDPAFPRASRPGAVAPDAPLGEGWLLNAVGGEVKLLAVGRLAPATSLPVVEAELNDATRARYLGSAFGALYLIRPDQVIAARWQDATPAEIEAAAKSIWEGPSWH